MSKPLEGILVISIEQAVAAPFCTSRLVDAGARVIKIERAEGDFARNYDDAAKGDSSYFIWINQCKESVVLDFKSKAGSNFLDKLLSKADVFIQNLGPGAIERAGFGSEQLRKKYPKLITCDISGYGENEEVKSLKSYDLLVQAESGLLSISGGPGEMGRIGVSACDIGAGMTAHAAIMEALLLRTKNNKGSSIKISLFDVMAEWMTVPFIHAEYGSGAPERVGLRHPSIAPYDAYETSDGMKTIVSIQNEREWVRFCEVVLQHGELATDQRFSSNNSRVTNRQELDTVITSVVSKLTSQAYRERLKLADLAYGSVNNVNDLAQHKALRKRTVLSTNQEEINIPAPPIKWGKQTSRKGEGVPHIGQHTNMIREEFL